MDYLDRLDDLYDKHTELFDRLDILLAPPKEFPDWDLMDEPDEDFMAISDRNAEEFLLDILENGYE